MKLFAAIILIFNFIGCAYAQDIATCGEPNGQAYYAFAGPISKKDAGWQKDGIKNGNFTFKRLSNKKFDVFYKDLYGNVGSVTDDGATVLLLRAEPNNIAVLVAYSGASEIYTYWKNNDGRLQYSFMQSKSAPVGIIKSALFVGDCSFINFDLTK